MKTNRLLFLILVILTFACSRIESLRQRITYDPASEYVSKINRLFEEGRGHCRLNSVDRSAVLNLEDKNLGFLQVQVSKSGEVDFYLADVFDKEEQNISPGAIFYMKEVSGKIAGAWIPTNSKNPTFQSVKGGSIRQLAFLYNNIVEFVDEGFEKNYGLKTVRIAIKGTDICRGFFSKQEENLMAE